MRCSCNITPRDKDPDSQFFGVALLTNGPRSFRRAQLLKLRSANPALVIDWDHTCPQVNRALVVTETDGVLVHAGTSGNGGVVFDSVERWIDRMGDDVVGSGECIAAGGGIGVHKLEDQDSATVVFHAGYTSDERALEIACDRAYLPHRSKARNGRRTCKSRTKGADISNW